jgi:hypothetical protein
MYNFGIFLIPILRVCVCFIEHVKTFNPYMDWWACV